jgi:aryl-alcohol dehydrogenase-like predicted oxidoreductase
MTGGEISRAGFGGYRISEHQPAHLAALELALEKGCTLFDTAPNYGEGESERLIGRAISNSRRSEVFITSKVGYAGEIDGDFFRGSSGQDALQSIKRTDDDSLHCLHPGFIAFKVHSSLRNLRFDYLDAVLLHNPEYQLGVEFDDILSDAFAVLDRFVEAGLIRCYGVSSNVLPFQGDVTLDRLIEAADRIGTGSGFKIIQFPCNLAEWHANEAQGGRLSLLASAKAHGIRTVANRPLNARTDRGAIRLSSDIEKGTAEKNCLSDFIRLLDDQLGERGIDGKIGDLPSVAKFGGAMETAVDPAALARLFHLTFEPILKAVFPGRLPGSLAAELEATSERVGKYARQRMARAAGSFAQQPDIVKRTRGVRGDTLQAVACQAVLDAGIDHVLIGMRRPEYVMQFQHLF